MCVYESIPRVIEFGDPPYTEADVGSGNIGGPNYSTKIASGARLNNALGNTLNDIIAFIMTFSYIFVSLSLSQYIFLSLSFS